MYFILWKCSDRIDVETVVQDSEEVIDRIGRSGSRLVDFQGFASHLPEEGDVVMVIKGSTCYLSLLMNTEMYE